MNSLHCVVFGYCRDILIGTEAGSLHTLHIEEKSKKEGPFTLLLDFKDRRKAICSVEQEVLPNGRRVVLVATPGSLYIAAGGPSLEAVFARWVHASVWLFLQALHSSLWRYLH